MLTLPDAILPVLHPFATLFRSPTWLKAQILLAGAILAPGQRTGAAARRKDRRFSAPGSLRSPEEDLTWNWWGGRNARGAPAYLVHGGKGGGVQYLVVLLDQAPRSVSSRGSHNPGISLRFQSRRSDLPGRRIPACPEIRAAPLPGEPLPPATPAPAPVP